jgi:hypothetical protein
MNCRPQEATRPGVSTVDLANSRLKPHFLRQLSRDGEILAAGIGLVQHVKIFSCQADAAKAIRTTRAGHALDQIGTRRTALTFDAMLATDQRLAISAMRAIRTTQASNTVVAPNQAL